jgi:HK97 family phage prohead protease
MPKEKKEIRMADVAINDSTPELMIIDGRAITFNSPTLIYEYEGIKYYEVIDAGALDQCDMSDVVLRYNHTEHMFIMARTRKGSLRLTKDELGLSLSATLFNITQARDLYTLIKEGAIDKMSFAFTVAEDSYNSETRTRTILKIKKLYDVAAVDTPAYDDTELSARSFFEVESEKERKLADADELRKKKLILLLELNGI